jgi:predicted GNAT family acetyltransferase
VASGNREQKRLNQLRDNAAAGRFEMDQSGLTVFADYRRIGDQLYIDHVEAPPALRGSGAASRLMEAVAQQARSEGLRIIPICSYAAAWLARRGELGAPQRGP